VRFVNGKQEGLKTTWYKSGAKASERYFINGKQEGLETWWYESGAKLKELHFENGEETIERNFYKS